MLSAAAAFFMADLFMTPVRRMKDGIDRISRGELDYRIESGGESELEPLAGSISKMVQTLKDWAVPVANLDRR